MSWDYEDIAKAITPRISARYGEASKEELLARIVELESQLYPFNHCLSSLLDKSWRGTNVRSKLFPLLASDYSFQAYDTKTGKTETFKLSESDYCSVSYYLEESLVIEDGSQLPDDFNVMSFHQEAPGAAIYRGQISISDVRLLNAVYNAPYRKEQANEEQRATDQQPDGLPGNEPKV